MKNKNKIMRGFAWVKFTIITSILLVLVIGGAFFYRQNSNDGPNFEFIISEIKDLVQFVSVTGNVQPVDEVDLAFEVTGRVEEVFADVGDRVKTGDPLIKLVNTDLAAELSKAQADLQNQRAQLAQLNAALDVEEARLDELERGTRDEEVEIAQTKVANAQKARADAELELANAITLADKNLVNLYDTGLDRINDAYIALDDAVRVKTDDFFSDSSIDEGDLVFIVEDPLTETRARNQRREVLTLITALEPLVQNPPSEQDELDDLLAEVETDLLVAQNYLFTLTLALTEEIDLEDELKPTFQTNVDLARDSISASKNQVSAIIQEIAVLRVANNNSITTAQNALNTAINAIALAEDELRLAQADTLPEQISSQNARIEQAKANILAQNARIQSAQSQVAIVQTTIEKTILRSPIDGIVTRQETKAGEIVTLRESLSPTVISIISDAQFEIESNIPEVDIAKVKIGDKATITLDAYGDDELFEVEVAMIDPAETIVEGVPTYKVTFVFTETDSRVKSGMTANIEILTAEADNVLAVPQRAVLSDSGRKYVRIAVDNQIEQRSVKTGLVSWDGQVEITEGLLEGEQVVTFIEE